MRGSGFYVWAGAIAVAAAVLLASFAIISSSPPPSPLATPPPEELSAAVGTDKFVYSSGEPVKITFTVLNVGTSTVNLTFNSTCQATFRVVDRDAATVYDDSAHRGCGGTITHLRLGPGANTSYGFTWEQLSTDGARIPAGMVYRVIARLLVLAPVSVPEAVSELAIWPVAEAMMLGFSAATDQPIYTQGDLASVSVTLTNLGSSSVTLRFGNPCFMEFLVYSAGADPQYNSSSHWACIEVLAQVTLEPGGSTTQTFPWNLSADDGTPLASGQWYEIIPQFKWGDPGYQQYVTRTDPATFYLRP